MQLASAYLPADRRRALSENRPLPLRASGSVLFVDISGFTPLTETLARQFGRSRGAELLTRTLNEVYQALIDQANVRGGSIIGFAGDAITCWFDAAGDSARDAAHRAASCAVAMQRAMQRFGRYQVAPGTIAELAIKTSLASGQVLRVLVGDPTIQVIEVLAGAPLARMAAGEHAATRGETIADRATIDLLGGATTVRAWRDTDMDVPVGVLSHLEEARVDETLDVAVEEVTTLPAGHFRPWLLPAVWANLQRGDERFLAELRPATALFVRFSGIDYECDQDAGNKLDAYIRWVQHVLARHEGSLIQLTTGDKGSYLYAAFGAPVAHDDDAERAVAAGLELRSSPAHFDFVRQVQIGISAGLMRVGAYGSSTRRTYGVLGDETNMAARLMVQAEPGQLLVSERVADLVRHTYLLDALGERQFKGKTEAQNVFAVLGLHSPTLLQLNALYHTPPLGREIELNALSAAINDAAAGNGTLVRIEGEAGAGKSHLAAAAARSAAAHDFMVLYGACQSTGQQPYAALRDPLAALLGLAELRTAPVDVQIEHLRATLAAIEPTWLVRLPLLGDLLDLPITDTPTTAAFDPRLRREALGSLVVSLMHYFAARQPIFLLLEDVHWLDEADQVIVLALCRTHNNTRMIVCLAHRPAGAQEGAFFGELDTLPEQLHLRLTELAASAVAALLRERLHSDVDPLVVELVYAQTQGNPFFVEEMIDALRERGAVVQEQGEWRAARGLVQALHEANSLERAGERWRLRENARLDAVTLGLPDTVHGLVLSRLDRLSEETRLTLKVASVIGRVFETRVLADAHPRPTEEHALLDQIAELESRDFARMEAPPPHPVYIFKHSLTQEAVYQTLLDSQRQELHLAVARVLEQRTPSAIERLAHHYSQTDLTRPETIERTIHYLNAAAWRAKRSYANETALAYFDRALALRTRWVWLQGKVEVLHILGQRLQEEATLLVLEHEPDADAARVAELWAEFHQATSRYPDARADLHRAMEVLAERSDRTGQARVLSRLGEIALLEGDVDEAEVHYRRALQILSAEHGSEDVRALAMLGLGVVMRQRGAYDDATLTLGQALDLYDAQENQPEVATALTRLGGVAFLRRDVDAALDAWNRALTIRRAIGDREGEGSSLLNIAQAYTSMGDYAAALPLLQRALEIQRSVGNRWWENAVWNALGVLALTVGDYAEARRCITIAAGLCAAIGNEAGAAIMEFNLGQIERECGDYAKAFERLQHSRQWAQENADLEFGAQCLTELALTAQVAGQFDEAEAYAQAALGAYETLDIRASTTTDLATLVLVKLARGERDDAWKLAALMMDIVEQCEVHQIEYPQRDLHAAAAAAWAVGEEDRARELLQQARALVRGRADRISDESMRQSYLERVRINRDALARSPVDAHTGGGLRSLKPR